MKDSQKDAQIAYNIQIKKFCNECSIKIECSIKKITISKSDINLFKGFVLPDCQIQSIKK